MLAKKQLLELLIQYKKEHQQETFNEEELAHWIIYQVCEDALAAKNSITVLSAALKVLEGKLNRCTCITLTCVSPGIFTANLRCIGGSITSSVNLSENDPLADTLVRLAREVI